MKTIIGYSRYAADKKGNLYSLDYKCSGETIRLRPALNKDGYLKTVLKNDEGRYVPIRVHKAVSLAYLGETPIGKEINHIDGNKLNNSPTNLEFISHRENVQHAFNNGLTTPMRGSKNGMSKLTESDVREIRKYASNSNGRFPEKEKIKLAKAYGVSKNHIKDIVLRRRNIWPHV